MIVAAVLVAWRVGRKPAAEAGPAAPSGHEGHTGAVGTPAGDSGRAVVHLSPDDERRIGVTWAQVERRPLGRVVRTVGQVTIDETRQTVVTSRVDGWVERLDVTATGQSVRAGDRVLALYAPSVSAAEEELLIARRLERELTGGSPDALRNAAEMVESARRRLEQWGVAASEVAEVERTGRALRTMQVVAPASGVVLEKRVVQGQRVMAGDPLLRLGDLTVVWVDGEVFERDFSAARQGARVVAEFDALRGLRREGKIAFVYPTVSGETHTARVRVVLENADLALKPGMYATLLIDDDERAAVLSVPRSAVLVTGERSIAFVRGARGAIQAREVTVGSSSDEWIEILGGLRQGETVVASATFLIDAESNLGKVLGGMGNMPGMDMTAPPAKAGVRPKE